MQEPLESLGINRKKYTRAMASNLSMLRAKIGVSQEELATLIGVTRQTISATENKTRELSWPNFLSMLFVFTQNPETRDLLPILGIYTPELERYFVFTDLNNLRE